MGGALNCHKTSEVSDSCWNEILERTRPEYRFLSRAWFEAWSEGYLPTPSLQGPVRYLLCTAQNDSPMGVFPYAEWHKLGITVWSLAGYYYPLRSVPAAVSAYQHVADAMAKAIDEADSVSAVKLGPVEDGDPTVTALIDKLLERGWFKHVADRGVQQIVECPTSYEDFHCSLSKSLRRSIRSRSKKMMSEGQVELRAYSGLRPDEWQRVLTEVAQVEGRSWLAQDAEGKPRFQGHLNEPFWQHLASNEGACDTLGVWMLYFDEMPVAFTVTIDTSQCRYNISGQYDERFKKYGPGWIVDNKLFKDSIEQGAQTINMGDGHPEYKSRWGAEPAGHLRDYLLCRPSITGFGLDWAARTKDTMADTGQQLCKALARLRGNG